MSAEELIRACSEPDDAVAWGEFVVRFNQSITLSVIRAAHHWTAVPHQILDDLVQETYLKLSTRDYEHLRDFAIHHPEAITGYIKTVAVNVVRDYFKSQHSQKRGAGKVETSLENINPTSRAETFGSSAAMERTTLVGQIDRCLETCSVGADQERDRLVFWLYYQQGMTAKDIAALPAVGLTVKGVESAILRLTRLVRERIVKTRLDQEDEPKSGQKGFRPAESY
jgi:RNA polymerase sigma-70 factor, ECF subfamily